MASSRQAGYVGLQTFMREDGRGTDSTVRFRNIRVKPLKPVSSSESEAEPLNPAHSPEFITTRVGSIKLKRIPAGTFFMGSPETETDARSNEKPQQRARITRSFYSRQTLNTDPTGAPSGTGRVFRGRGV